MLLFNSKAMLSQWKLHAAAVNFDMYQNLQRHRAVLAAVAWLSGEGSCHADAVELCDCRHWACVDITLYSLLCHDIIQQWRPSVDHSTTLVVAESSQLTIIQTMTSTFLNQQQVSLLCCWGRSHFIYKHFHFLHIYCIKTQLKTPPVNHATTYKTGRRKEGEVAVVQWLSSALVDSVSLPLSHGI